MTESPWWPHACRWQTVVALAAEVLDYSPAKRVLPVLDLPVICPFRGLDWIDGRNLGLRPHPHLPWHRGPNEEAFLCQRHHLVPLQLPSQTPTHLNLILRYQETFHWLSASMLSRLRGIWKSVIAEHLEFVLLFRCQHCTIDNSASNTFLRIYLCPCK